MIPMLEYEGFAMPEFAPVDDQLAILLHGAAQVETVAELKQERDTVKDLLP